MIFLLEIDSIASSIIDMFKEKKLEQTTDSEEEECQQFLIAKSDLISWYMDKYLNHIQDSDDQVSEACLKILHAIDSMVKDDMSLIVSFYFAFIRFISL